MTALNRAGPRRAAGDNLTAYLRGIGDRLDRVERGRRLSFSSIGGTLRVEDGGAIVVGDGAGARTISLDPPPDATGLSLSTGIVDRSAYVDAAWTPIAGVDAYDVFVEEAGVGIVRVERTSATLIRLAPLAGDTEHTIRVAGVSTVGVPGATVSDVITTPAVPGEGAPTTAPTDAPVVDVAGGFEGLVVAWPLIAGADRYRVSIDAAVELVASANVVSIPRPPGTYEVIVEAGNAAGYGPPSTAVSGEVVELTIPAGRDFTTDPILATELATDAVTTPKLTANAVEAGKIATDAIESRHVQTDALLARHIQAGQIDADHIIAGGITAAVITAGTMSGDRIAVGTLDGDRITVGTLTADAIGTGTLSAATITLAGGGLFRAGRTAAPFHYLTLGESGLRFLTNGSAPYTGGTTVLNLDVATGTATLSGVTVTGTVNATGGSITGSLAVSGTLTGGTIRTSAGSERVELAGGSNELQLHHGALGNPAATQFSRMFARATNFGNATDGETTSRLHIETGDLGINLYRYQGWSSGSSGFGYAQVIIGGPSGDPQLAPSGGLEVQIVGYLTTQGITTTGPLLVSNSLTVDNSLTDGHYAMIRSGIRWDTTIVSGAYQLRRDGVTHFRMDTIGGRFYGNLVVDGNLTVNGSAPGGTAGSMQRRRTLTQSISNGSWTAISWNSTPYSDTGWSGLSTGISPPVSGRYLVTVTMNAGWSQTVGQRSAVRLRIDGTGSDEDRFDFFPSISGWGVVLTSVVRILSSTRIDAEVFQNSGGSRTLNAGATITMTYLGPY